MPTEAPMTISSTELNSAQSMAVRVAVASMLADLNDKEFVTALGEIAELYRARLLEVQSLIFTTAE